MIREITHQCRLLFAVFATIKAACTLNQPNVQAAFAIFKITKQPAYSHHAQYPAPNTTERFAPVARCGLLGT